jgi:hypothetical protein
MSTIAGLTVKLKASKKTTELQLGVVLSVYMFEQ